MTGEAAGGPGRLGPCWEEESSSWVAAGRLHRGTVSPETGGTKRRLEREEPLRDRMPGSPAGQKQGPARTLTLTPSRSALRKLQRVGDSSGELAEAQISGSYPLNSGRGPGGTRRICVFSKWL